MSLQSLITSMVAARVDFVVVGGVAGGIHGSPFATNDLDVCYATSHANMTRISKLLGAWAAYPRGWEPGLPFTTDARTLKTTPILTLRTAEGDLDLLDRVDGVGTYTEVFESSEEVTAFGIRFRVLTLDALIRARRASARPKDLAQLPTLEALAELKSSDTSSPD
jgi:predicted nucleotidyltransferase